jgi:hypothetical protein
MCFKLVHFLVYLLLIDTEINTYLIIELLSQGMCQLIMLGCRP